MFGFHKTDMSSVREDMDTKNKSSEKGSGNDQNTFTESAIEEFRLGKTGKKNIIQLPIFITYRTIQFH